MQNICELTGRLCPSIVRQINLVPRRHARKPSWLGFAKSKQFRLPRPNGWTKSETEERLLLQRHHDTYMKSLRAFQEKAYALHVEQSAAHAKQISEDAEIGKLAEEIARDNAVVRERREKALVLEWKQVEENIIRQRTEYEQETRRNQELAEKELRVHMERLKSSIKLGDLDAKIGEILATTIDHNFAIDRTGKVYFGRLNSNVASETHGQDTNVPSSSS